jgi:hypothetical protein
MRLTPPGSGALVRNVTRDLLSRIEFRDLEFARRPTRCYSSRGTPFVRWEPVGMPRVPQKILDSVCYLYEDEEQAKAGREFGGTAFLVSVPSERHQGANYAYVVSNWHVACQGCPVVRINTKDGGADIILLEPDHWEFDPRYDIAVAPLPVREDLHRFATVPSAMFVSREQMAAARMGAGEDVFMVGRFVDHDGGPVNLPALRFGNISVMPTPIEQPNGRKADCFCIDLHARTGYSGSPVFVYRTPGFDLEENLEAAIREKRCLAAGCNMFMLLGIHFGHFKEYWQIIDNKPNPLEPGSSLLTEGKYIKGLSGMSCALPAWNIMEILNIPKFKNRRHWQDDLAERSMMQNNTRPEPDVVSPVRDKGDNDWFEPEEAARRRDDTLRRMLATPPKPQKDMKIGGRSRTNRDSD